MLLITETTDTVDYLVEGVEPSSKRHFIQGIFLQANVKNRNGRIYPTDILAKEVDRYTSNYILQDRALGELGHPDGPRINLDRVSHKITELKRDGNNYVGKAMILDTPNGRTVKGLIEGNVKFGVSSRGMGTLKMVNGVNYVNEDFMLATAADIVSDPSAPHAFVNGIMEGVEWVWNNGIFEERHLETEKTRLDTAARKGLMSERYQTAILESFARLMKGLVSKS